MRLELYQTVLEPNCGGLSMGLHYRSSVFERREERIELFWPAQRQDVCLGAPRYSRCDPGASNVPLIARSQCPLALARSASPFPLSRGPALLDNVLSSNKPLISVDCASRNQEEKAILLSALLFNFGAAPCRGTLSDPA